MLTSRCAWCERTPERDQLKLCSACKKTAYCSRDCQAKQWPKHRMVCKDSGFVKLLSSPVGYETMQHLQNASEKYFPINIWRTINDTQRITSYRNATVSALYAAWKRCKPKTVKITFLGSGTGYTPAYIAKEAQANDIPVSINVIEQEESSRRLVEKVLAANGVSSSITLSVCPQYYGVSKQINGSADIVVFEDVDNYIVGRGMVRALSQEIMTSNTIVIPSKASLHAFGAEMASKVDGMNMRPLNKLFWSPRPRTFINSKFVYRRITEDTHICTYDFSDPSLLKGAGSPPRTIDFTAKASGRMNCVIYWVSIELWDKITISSNPSSGNFKSLRPLYQSVSEMKMTPPPPPSPPQDPHGKQSHSQSPRQNSENTNKSSNDSKSINTAKEGPADHYAGEDIFSYRRFFVYRTKEGTIVLSEGVRHVDVRREMPVLISFPVNPKPVIPPSLYSTLMSRAHCLAYRRGLDAALKSRAAGTTVLSLNSGAGIVPMLAATNGAECVIGTEEHTSLWKASQQVLRANEPSPGAFGTVSLINSESTQIMPGVTPGFGARASVCVFEGFNGRLLGNGLIAALEHAHKYLVSAGCCAVPALVTVYGALVDLYKTEIVCKGPKINVSGLNEIMLGMNEDLDLPSSVFITKPFPIFKFNFGMSPMCNIPKGGSVNIDARVTTQGVASGVAIWFEVDMDGTGKAILTNAPQSFPSSGRSYGLLEDMAENAGLYSMRGVWGQNVNWFNSPYQVAKGSKITLKAYYTNSDINVVVNKYSRDVTQMDVHPLVAGKGSSEICSKRAVLRVKLRKMLTKRPDKVPDPVDTVPMGSRKVVKKGKKGSTKAKRNRKKAAKGKEVYDDDDDDDEEYDEDEEDEVDGDYDEDGDSDSWEGEEDDDEDDEDDENEYYSDGEDDEEGEESDEDEDEDESDEESGSSNSGDEYLDGNKGNGKGGNKKSSARVKEDLSYLDDEYDEEDYDEDDEDDIWNILGAITENAVELGIDPDIAADFILDLCRDF